MSHYMGVPVKASCTHGPGGSSNGLHATGYSTNQTSAAGASGAVVH